MIPLRFQGQSLTLQCDQASFHLHQAFHLTALAVVSLSVHCIFLLLHNNENKESEEGQEKKYSGENCFEVWSDHFIISISKSFKAQSDNGVKHFA